MIIAFEDIATYIINYCIACTFYYTDQFLFHSFSTLLCTCINNFPNII